jgi:hypothetical protein
MFARAFLRTSVPKGITRIGVRKMGGGHHAPPPSDGIDGAVRKYLKEDEHVTHFPLKFNSFFFNIFV